MESTIEVSDLRKRYGRTVALDGMSFTVRPGHVTGFVGPNGAGKSTTMRVVLGLAAPDAGTALVGGVPYRTLRRPLTQLEEECPDLKLEVRPPGTKMHEELAKLINSSRLGNLAIEAGSTPAIRTRRAAIPTRRRPTCCLAWLSR